MRQQFNHKVIIAALMLSMALFISCPVGAQEEAVYISINQIDQDAAAEAGMITMASDGTGEDAIEIHLDNEHHKLASINMEVCTEDTYLTLAACVTTDRTGGFLCRARGSANGCSSITLFSMNRIGVIEEGEGPIFILRYRLSEEAPAGECTPLSTENTGATDDHGNVIEVISSPG